MGKRMIRLKLALIVLGGVVAFWGFEESQLASLAKTEASETSLESLEKSGNLENAHLRIGEHVSAYYGLVYEYSQSKYSTGEPSKSTSVTCAYYPIISPTNDFIVKLQEVLTKYPDGVPDNVPVPELKAFSVLVKTKRFSTVGALPTGMDKVPSIQGLVINEIESLGSDEKRLIRESFPGVNLTNLYILEEGRKPSSAFKYLGMMVGGCVLSLFGVGLFFMGRGEKKEIQAPLPK
jgi:hypothetical protein